MVRLLKVTRRILGRALLVLAGLVLCVGVVLLIPAARGALLGWGLGFVEDALPGRLSTGKVAWPALGRVVLTDVIWVSDAADAPGDTLVDLARLDLTLDLKSLRARRCGIEAAVLELRSLDVPALAAAFPGAEAKAGPDPTAPAGQKASIPYLLPGSLPGFPSVTVARLELEGDMIRLDPGFAVRDLVLEGRVDISGDGPATAVVDHASARLLGSALAAGGDRDWEMVIGRLGCGVALQTPGGGAGDWTMVTGALDSLNLDFVFPGSAQFEPWLPGGVPYEEIESLAGNLFLAGQVSGSDAAVSLRLDLGSNPWLDKGLIVGSASADIDSLGAKGLGAVAARLDTLEVALTGVRVAGSGAWGSETGDLDVTASLTDLRLPGLFASRMDPAVGDLLRDPGPISLDAVAKIERTGHEFAGRLDCDFLLPGAARFHHWLPPDFPYQEFGPLAGSMAVTGKYADPRAEGTLRLDLGSDTWLENGLIRGSAQANVDSLADQGLGGIIARLDTLDLALKGMRVAASGAWDSGHAGLDVTLGLTDLHLPSLFASRLEAPWGEILGNPGQVKLEAKAGLERTAGMYSGRLDGTFLLPGSGQFKAWLPEYFPHEEFDSLAGSLAVSGSYAAPRAQGTLRLDLGSNSPGDRALIAGSAAADLDSLREFGLACLTARLDTLVVAVTGLRANASGELGPGIVALDLEGDLTDFTLPGLFAGPALAEADLSLQVKAAVAGSLADPQIDAWVGGSFHHEGVAIPDFNFELNGNRRDVSAFLQAGGGLEYKGTALDSVRARVAGRLAAGDSLTADFALGVWQWDYYLGLGGSVQGDSVRVVRLDSLITVSFGQEMRMSGPVTFTMGPAPGTFALSKLEFTGPTGSVVAEGFSNEAGMDLEADIHLLLAEKLLQLIAPSPLWSIKGGADLKLDATVGLVGGGDEPKIDGRVSAGIMPHRNEPPFGFAIDFKSLGGPQAALNADFSLKSGDSSLLDAQLVWPGKPGPTRGFWNPDPAKDMVLTVPAQKLDVTRLNRRLPQDIALEGVFDLAAEVHVFPPGKESVMADSLVLLPLHGSIDASAASRNLRVSLPNRSWLETRVGASVAGPLADPVVSGKVEVTSGFIRIPELPRNIHPVRGNSMLWTLNDSLAAGSDAALTDSAGTPVRAAASGGQVIFVVPDQKGPALDETGPIFFPNMDLEVVVTKDLRIIGYGADLRLTGEIQVTRGFDVKNHPGPSLAGEVRVQDGTLKVMNRIFSIERGKIKFANRVPPNPNLDLMMETQVGSYLVRILISGAAADPVIELTSEPDLSEEDIMAVLLFGQPLSDLDNDQRGGMHEQNDPSRELQKNLAGLAMAMGSRRLQDSMSDSFGVDMVQMGSDSSGKTTLMVGKFITPEIMLKYHQSLENSGTYFMTLEYTLTRFFKIVSTYGQGEEASGAELRWSRRY